jgi:prepilin-type N-terminal cleavage/methylation domain-containing protein
VSKRSDAGFSLVETLVSIGVLSVVALGVAQLFALSMLANRNAKLQTSTALLATEKMEQLKALTWGFDTTGLGLPLTDTTTNLSNTPPTTDGNGLNPSPSGTLQTNTPGYVDYLDAFGNWAGNGSTPPANAVYIRRWAIEPLPTNPNNTLILQVFVTTPKAEALFERAPTGQSRVRLADDAWIVGVKTRKAP